MKMDSRNNVKIKVENEAHNDYEEEDFMGYTITSFSSCKEEQDISDYTLGTESPTPLTSTTPHQNDTDGSPIIENKTMGVTRLNCHNKKAILKHIYDKGWTSKSYKELCKKIPQEKVDEYGKTINRAIQEAQQFVYQECDSLCFGNISDWLEVFKTMKVPENCYYEPAIIVNAIVNNEKLPDPENLEGVDLKQIYSFLCNGLMGIPQKEMDPVTAKFLANEFESLINEANSDVADSHTLFMKQKLQSTMIKRKGQVPPSLDPLWLTEGTIVHNQILNDRNEVTIVQNDIIVQKNESANKTHNGPILNPKNEDTYNTFHGDDDTSNTFHGDTLNLINDDTTKNSFNGTLNPKIESTN